MITARSQHLNSNIARALTSFNIQKRASVSLTTTPTHSQPSSPMRKEIFAFSFSSESRSGPAVSSSRHESCTKNKILKLMLDRSQVCIIKEIMRKESPQDFVKILFESMIRLK